MQTRTNLIIVDNFYSNPYEVREHALDQYYGVTGNYPGRRTESMLNNSTKENLASLLRPHAGKVTSWNDHEYSGAYQYTLASDRSWIHHDGNTSWAGVLYLTPNAPLTAGTATYRHKETGMMVRPDHDEDLSKMIEEDGQDLTKWDVVDRVSNVFNRLVIYRGDLFHMSQDYFGKDIHDGRLFQTFFINTEY
jgi:hypothetical protein